MRQAACWASRVNVVGQVPALGNLPAADGTQNVAKKCIVGQEPINTAEENKAAGEGGQKALERGPLFYVMRLRSRWR